MDSKYQADQLNVCTGVTRGRQPLTDQELLTAMGWDENDDEISDLMGGSMRAEMLAQGRDIERAVVKKIFG
ncbi:MAG: hypothetical protein RLZZ454_95 [Pseudomonadota bacterium]|jgi:hypothetical protein